MRGRERPLGLGGIDPHTGGAPWPSQAADWGGGCDADAPSGSDLSASPVGSNGGGWSPRWGGGLHGCSSLPPAPWTEQVAVAVAVGRSAWCAARGVCGPASQAAAVTACCLARCSSCGVWRPSSRPPCHSPGGLGRLGALKCGPAGRCRAPLVGGAAWCCLSLRVLSSPAGGGLGCRPLLGALDITTAVGLGPVSQTGRWVFFFAETPFPRLC